MLKKFLKPLTLVLALLMVISVFAACGQGGATPGGTEKTSAKTEQSTTQTELAKSPYQIQKEKFQAITMYLPGAGPTDFEKVMVKVNEKLKENVNASLAINFVSWGDFDTKFPLLLASGEAFDLILSSKWAKFSDGVIKGAYLPLDKLLPDYAPGVWKDLPQEFWEGAKYKGNIMAIPANYSAINTFGLFYRDDLRVKYGLNEIKTIEDFENYLDAVKKNETEIKPFMGGKFDVDLLQWITFYFNPKKYTAISSTQRLLGYVESEPDKLYSALDPYPGDLEAGAKFREVLSRWNNKGLISKNMSANKTRGIEYVRNGTSAVAALNMTNSFDEYVNIKNAHPDWEFKYFEFDINADIIQKATPDQTSVYKNSPNPEKALMVYDQLCSNQEINQLTRYGIKGVHYDVTPEGKFFVPEGTDATLFAPEAMSSWTWRQDRYEIFRKGDFEWLSKLREDVVVPKAKILLEENFVADTAEIAAEIAACSQISNTYAEGFSSGILDPVKDYDDMVAKLKKAGMEKVQQVVQAQWTEYLKTVKK